MHLSVPPAPGPLPPSTYRPLRRRKVVAFSLALLGLSPLLAQNHTDQLGPDTPRGRIRSQRLQLEAPKEACIAYLDTFRHRRWSVSAPTPEAFLNKLTRAGISEAIRRDLANPALWHETSDAAVFEITPPSSLLLQLQPAERFALYHLLAFHESNKVERWPLVFRDQAAFDRLLAAGVPASVVHLTRRLAYPFPGGWAFSDFSVLAEQFPEPATLLQFLQNASVIDTVLPRLTVLRAGDVVETLAYWTAAHHNPFSEPLLTAMLESPTERGIELASLLPGLARSLSYDLDADDVHHDFAINSFIISASLAAPPQPAGPIQGYFQWLNRHFTPVKDEARFGDLLVLRYSNQEPVLDYACAFVVDDLVFAKDPVGLGLWRFIPIQELLKRNPHFASGRFQRLRYQVGP